MNLTAYAAKGYEKKSRWRRLKQKFGKIFRIFPARPFSPSIVAALILLDIQRPMHTISAVGAICCKKVASVLDI